MANAFNAADHYWFIGDPRVEDGRLFSSARAADVERDDPGYLAWVEAGGSPSVVFHTADLCQLLGKTGLPAATILAAAAGALPGISKRQMLTWLLSNKNKTDADVLAAIDTIPDAVAQAQARIDYLYPDGPLHRANPLFDELGAQFQMSPAEIDAAFIAAAQL